MNVRSGALAGAMGLMVATGLVAQERDVQSRVAPARAGATAARTVHRLSVLTRSEVMLREGRPAGRIVDVVLSDHGCVEYLVAEYEREFYAIPFSAAKLDFEERVVQLSLTPTQFQRVTTFTEKQWPDFRDAAWQREAFEFWDVRAARSTAEERSTLRPVAPGERRDGDVEPARPGERDPRTPSAAPREPDPREPGASPRDPNRPREPGATPREPRSTPREPGASPRDPNRPGDRPPSTPGARPNPMPPRAPQDPERPRPRPDSKPQ